MSTLLMHLAAQLMIVRKIDLFLRLYTDILFHLLYTAQVLRFNLDKIYLLNREVFLSFCVFQ